VKLSPDTALPNVGFRLVGQKARSNGTSIFYTRFYQLKTAIADLMAPMRVRVRRPEVTERPYFTHAFINQPVRLIEAVEKGDIDIAAAWGPLAGYAAKIPPVPLTLVPITDTEDFVPLRFQFDIAMGVRKGDHALKVRLDDIIMRRQPEIRALLATKDSDSRLDGANAGAAHLAPDGGAEDLRQLERRRRAGPEGFG
jgi:hypothetical protein